MDANALMEIGSPVGLEWERNAAAVYLSSLHTEDSRRTMRAALNEIASLLAGGPSDALVFNWARVRFQHVQAVQTRLAERNNYKTVNKKIAALCGTLHACFKLELMSAEDYARARDVERLAGETVPRGRALTPGEIAAVFDECANDRTPAGARDAALLALLRLGLRRAEIAGLELANFDAVTGALVIKGKGNKQRTAYLEGGARAAVEDWLALRGLAPGALLCPVSQVGEIELRALSTQAIYNALAKRAERAHVKNITPHDWRRTFAGDLLDAGADLATVQRLMGHADPKTTSNYDRRTEATKRKATALLHVPYTRRAIQKALGE